MSCWEHHSRVRLKVGGLGENWWSALGRFGQWRREADWAVVDGIDPSRVAELVGERTRAAGQVEAVIPEQQSLESRFLESLEER